MKSRCSECNLVLHEIKTPMDPAGYFCSSCQEPIPPPLEDDQEPTSPTSEDDEVLSEFCKRCSDSIFIIWYFENSVNPDLDMWDDEQRWAADSIVDELNGLGAAQELACFAIRLESKDQPIIKSPIEMQKQLSALLALYEHVNNKPLCE